MRSEKSFDMQKIPYKNPNKKAGMRR